MIRTIGIIGSEPAGLALAGHAAREGLPVLLAQPGSPAVAPAATADVVILALPIVRVPELTAAVPRWDGKLVIDATVAVVVQLPGAVTVKAFGALDLRHLAAGPRHPEGRQVVFYAGDDADGNASFAELAHRLGFAPVHVGSLREGGRLLQPDGYLTGVHLIRDE